MSDKRHILLLGPTDDYFDKVAACGHHVTVLTEPSRLTARQKIRGGVTLLADFRHFPSLLLIASDAHQHTPFDAVISFTEYGMEPAAMIAAALNLPGPDLRSTLICRDKVRTREAVGAHALSALPFAAITDNAQLAQFIAGHALPVVVKPRSATGSQQVAILNHPGDTLPAIAGDWLVECFAPGKEYSCETFSVNGRHTLVAVTEKLLGGTSGLVEVGHKILPQKILTAEFEQWLFQVLEAIELKNGVGHTEIKIEGDTINLIECHNRPGGDRIWQLVELAIGIDLITLATRLLCGEAVTVPPPQSRCAAMTYFQFQPGPVTLSSHPFIAPPAWVRWYEWTLKPGDEIPPMTDSFHRHGGFIVDADDHASLNQRIAQVLHETVVR
ncbi:ATP-grasp domain-containing protein [Chimaeribacter californicus]|nr:ATP-grasp domain-containing protein [Chimaeribacter californicus]